MRLLYLFSLLALGLTAWLGVGANDAREATMAARAQNAVMRAELRRLEDEVATMEKIEPMPMRFSDDAMSEFFSRTVEAGEVLGAGVRIEPRDAALGARTMAFVDFRNGVRVCPTKLQAAMEGDQAPAVLAMFEEELADLPVAVRKIAARKAGRDVSVTMEVDVFGRTQ